MKTYQKPQYFRANCLVQLCDIDPSKKHHVTKIPMIETLAEYFAKNGVSYAFVVYEEPLLLEEYARSLDVELVPVFRVRDTQHPDLPLGRKIKPAGVKIHPFLFRFEFSLEAVKPTLDMARRHGLFVCVHMDDRSTKSGKPVMCPAMAAEMARAYPDLTFIFNHAGSFAPRGRVRLEKSYPDVFEKLQENTKKLVLQCVDVMADLPNVYAETSILSDPNKAKIIASRMPLDRVLIGTDFPISSAPRIDYQEQKLMDCGLTVGQIAAIHKNALKFPALKR